MMRRLAIKRTTKRSRRKREREFFFTTTRVLIYSALLTVEDDVTFDRHASVDLVIVVINERLRSDSSIPAGRSRA